MPNTDYPDRIHAYMTKTSYLHFEDSLSIGKIKLFAGRYNMHNKPNYSLRHYIDADTLRPILMNLSWGRDIDIVDYKGGAGDGGIISRVLSINCKEDKVFWQLTHGPGTKTKTGAVTPARLSKEQKEKLTTSVTVMVSKEDCREIACKLTEYMQAWKTAQLISTSTPNYRAHAEDTHGIHALNYYNDLGLEGLIQS